MASGRPGKYADIDVDDLGLVVVNRKGMSVSADWRTLQPHLIPEELDDGTNGASGRGMEVFVMGQGPFADGPVAAGLELLMKPNSLNTGNVCPTVAVLVAEYQANLAATQPEWIIDPS